MLSCFLDLTGELTNNNPLNLPVARVSLPLSNIAIASPKYRHPVIRFKGRKPGGMWLGEPLGSTLYNSYLIRNYAAMA